MQEYRELAAESGIAAWGRVPALNTNPAFIADLADMVLEKLPSAAPRPAYLADAQWDAENLNLGPPTGMVPAGLVVLEVHPCMSGGGSAIEYVQGLSHASVLAGAGSA